MSELALLVVDTSVAVKWYVPEPGAEAAAALLKRESTLIAPDLIGPELGNVLWKKVRRQELGVSDARGIIEAFAASAPVRLVPSGPYLPGALEIALLYGRSVYDALYPALALDRGGRYVTADERLVNALAATSLAPSILQLGA